MSLLSGPIGGIASRAHTKNKQSKRKTKLRGRVLGKGDRESLVTDSARCLLDHAKKSISGGIESR